MTTRGSPKIFYGGKPKNNPPPPCKKKDPPHRKKCPQHEENVYTFCIHRKNAPIGEKKPLIQLFYSCSAPPPEQLLTFPLPCDGRS